MQHTMIEVNKLDASPLNVRRTAGGALAEMKASLLAHGLMQNLVVTKAGEGRFLAIAGARRLAALRELQQEGKLPSDYSVPCQIVSDDRATEMSLAENTVRLAMHPADEFEAFARLIDDGHSAQQVAERFGVPVRHIEQRLRLGRVAPELLTAYRAEELTLECLMAFALTDDRAKQLRVYESLPDWQKDDAGSIRQALTESAIEADDKLARFVGLDAYHAAGGVSRADLFGDEVYLENPELLHQLAAAKLDAARQELEAEGWKWVEVSPDQDWTVLQGCSRIYPQPVDVPQELTAAKERAEAELEAIAEAAEIDGDESHLSQRQEAAEAELADIEEKLEAFVAFDPAEMRSAGCYVSIGHDGELSVVRGLVRREDMRRLEHDGEARTPKPKGMPDSLRRDLESYRLQAAQVEIARHRLVALDLLVFNVASSLLTHRPSASLDVQFREQHATPTVRNEQTAAGDALEAIRDALPLAWLHQPTEAEQFQAFIGLSDKDKLDLLAYCVAMSLKPQLSIGHESTACELALSLTDASMEAYWRPTRRNYLGRVTRDQLLAIGAELLGDQWPQARSRDKKGELADALERAFADPQKLVCTSAQREQLMRWLPQGMAFGTATAGQAESETQHRNAA